MFCWIFPEPECLDTVQLLAAKATQLSQMCPYIGNFFIDLFWRLEIPIHTILS